MLIPSCYFSIMVDAVLGNHDYMGDELIICSIQTWYNLAYLKLKLVLPFNWDFPTRKMIKSFSWPFANIVFVPLFSLTTTAWDATDWNLILPEKGNSWTKSSTFNICHFFMEGRGMNIFISLPTKIVIYYHWLINLIGNW